jgi:hypothetical protein
MRSRPHVALVCVASSVITRSGSTYATAGSPRTSASAFSVSFAEKPFTTREYSRWTFPPRSRTRVLALSAPVPVV